MPPATAPPARGGRGGRGSRGGRGVRGAARGGTKAKRSATDPDSDYEDDGVKTKPAVKKRKVEKPPLEPRALPQRVGRVEKPGLPDAPRFKKTSATVEEEREAIAAEIAELVRRHGELVGDVAAANVMIDEAAVDEERDAVLTLADHDAQTLDHDDAQDGMEVDEDEEHEDIAGGQEDEVVLELTEEDFQRVEDEEAYASAGDFDKPKAKAPKRAAPKKPRKLTKGELVNEVELATKTLAAEKKAKAAPVKLNGVQNSDAAAASKKAGISKCFIAPSTSTKAVTPQAESPILGGLHDIDASAQRPEFSGDKAKLPARINESIIIDGSSDVEDTPNKPPAKSALPAKLVKLGWRATPKPRTVKSEPSSKMQGLSLKSLAKTPKAKIVKTESSSDASAFTPDSSSDVKGLPAFAGPTWESHFLPKLYEAVNRSEDPMAFAAYGDSLIIAEAAVHSIQNVVNDVYPGSTFKVQWGDKLCSRACSRVRGRRNAVKCAADTAVTTHLASLGLYDAQGIRAFVQYALRGNGPAFWRDPTPETCVLAPTAQGYIKPNGYLESALMVATLTPFLKNVKILIPEVAPDGSWDPSGLPIGLLAMAKGALHRALSLYTATGTVAIGPQPQFSSETSGGQVLACMTTIQRFTWTRWSSILISCGANLVEDLAPAPSATYDSYADDMYIPSSPPA
ncbi:hypothetical protein B0H10DRAFT_1962745 [Mycena sp. CBHHK59/15]|nr:hypothetical protein B0H10DRAFT_1962745 [Mycena sp. CBHHK59/15]